LFGGYKGFIRKKAQIDGISVKQIDGLLPDLPDGTRLAILSIKYNASGETFYCPEHAGKDEIKTLSSRITKITGKYGSYIDSLYFHTEGQVIGNGGDGGHVNIDFHIKDDWFLLYLRGYHGSVLDWFTPVIARFKDARWEDLED